MIFNRQPSLHKPSLMGHRVKLVDTHSFLLNLSVTAPYNADFDGDEMNLHVPQSVSARANVAMLMGVTEQIISPAANKPCFALAQDSLLGAYLITRDDVLLGQREASALLLSLRHHRPARSPLPRWRRGGVPLWTGRQPPRSSSRPTWSVTANCAPSRASTSWRVGSIRDGEILAGRLDKATLGASAGGIVDVLRARPAG